MHDAKPWMQESGVAALATDEEAKARMDEIRNLIAASRNRDLIGCLVVAPQF